MQAAVFRLRRWPMWRKMRLMLEYLFANGPEKMIEERDLVQNFLNRKQRERLKKPDWLKIKLGDPRNQNAVLDLISGLNLHTVCQEAKCPNIFECWTDKTATFML